MLSIPDPSAVEGEGIPDEGRAVVLHGRVCCLWRSAHEHPDVIAEEEAVADGRFAGHLVIDPDRRHDRE